ncbi:MAG TPA: hypothetical protein VJS44_07735 [Pyrinomonadaceae bacterium]|nr:hypothetical protein [Pyrinomonadaceae bacterium]
MKKLNAFFFALCCSVALVAFSSSHTNAQTGARAANTRETFTGTIVGIGGTLGGRSRPFTLDITGTTPDADVTRYVELLAARGQDAIMEQARNQRLGKFSISGQLGRDVNFVRIHPTENGGRRIVVIFERWLNTFELRYGTRSADYPFSYAEIYVDSQGRGEGTFIPAARIRFDDDDNRVEVVNFGIYPARLMGVRQRR